MGVTVLVAMGLLGWMIFKFGDAPARFFRPPQISVKFAGDRADGLGDGSAITYMGVSVGRVTKVKRVNDPVRIEVTADLDKEPALPGNLKGRIVFTSPLGGVSSLELVRDETKTEGSVMVDGAELRAEFLGSTFLPPEFAEAAKNIGDAVKAFNDSKMIESLKETVELTKKRIDETGKVIDGVASLVNDPKMRADLQQSLANVRTASDDAAAITNRVRLIADKMVATADRVDTVVGNAGEAIKTTEKQIDRIGGQMSEQLVRLGQLLDNVQSISSKIDKGTGTAGQLVNDPKLYQGLVDSTRELNLALSDVRRLVQQWEQEGVSLKLGK